MESWQRIARKKQLSRDSNIPEEWRLSSIPSAAEQPEVVPYLTTFLSAEELDITEQDVSKLAPKLANGTLTYACFPSSMI
jgi:hypothetical protein